MIFSKLLLISLVYECILAFRNFVKKTHLEKFIDGFEQEIFRIKIVELVAYSFVDAVECESFLHLLQFVTNKLF